MDNSAFPSILWKVVVVSLLNSLMTYESCKDVKPFHATDRIKRKSMEDVVALFIEVFNTLNEKEITQKVSQINCIYCCILTRFRGRTTGGAGGPWPPTFFRYKFFSWKAV